MAVLIEAINIVVNNNSLIKDRNIEEQFLRNVPSQTYCSDGLLHRIGFMDQISANNYIHYLTNDLGLTYLDDDGKAVDFVLVDMMRGPLSECDWLRFKRAKVFAHRVKFEKSDEDFSIAWRRGDFEGKDNEYIVETKEGKVQTMMTFMKRTLLHLTDGRRMMQYIHLPITPIAEETLKR